MVDRLLELSKADTLLVFGNKVRTKPNLTHVSIYTGKETITSSSVCKLILPPITT